MDNLLASSSNHNCLREKWCLLLLFFCLVGLQGINAQIIQLDGVAGDTAIIAPKLDCATSPGILYRDDNGGGSRLYADNTARKDTVTICPATSWDIVSLIFTQFDVAAGDTLLAFDGDLVAVRANAIPIGIGSGSGVGNSNAFGGWIKANCDPSVNPTGCLTLIFQTNGDNRKATGWEAWASCASRDIALKAPANIAVFANCSTTEPAPVAMIPITAAELTGSCTVTNQIIRVRITNLATLTQCIQENANAGAAIPSSPIKLAPGLYLVEHILQADTLKRDSQYIKINEPNLVCNDEVTVALDGSCRSLFDIDGLLEGDTCVGSGVAHHIIIRNGLGKIIAQGRHISLDTIQLEGKTCGENPLTATVVRTFHYATSTALCKPDSLVDSCVVILNVKDETIPYFERTSSKVDTLVGCDTSIIDTKSLTIPIVLDNCKDTIIPTFTVLGLEQYFGICEYPRDYLIKWEATDSCNNATPIIDTIRIIRPTEFAGSQSITEDCAKEKNGLRPLISKARVRPGLKTGKFQDGQFTATGVIRLSFDSTECGYILVILDSTDIVGPCGNRFAFVSWAYLDWCNPGQNPVFIDSQKIRFIDQTAPVIDTSNLVSFNDLADTTKNRFDIGTRDCTLNFDSIILPPIPEATDNCAEAENVKVSLKNIQQLVNGKWDTIAPTLEAAIAANLLVPDTFRVSYESMDNCQEKAGTATSHFILENNDSTTAPEIICTDQINVSLNNNVGVKIRPSDLDITTKPGCNRSIDTLLIRRKGTKDWVSTVLVTCHDIGKPFDVEIQVIDDKGNKNRCWLSINSEDKIAPICGDLTDKMRTCDEFHTHELGKSTDTNQNGLMDDDWVFLNPNEETLAALLERYNKEFDNPLSVCQDSLGTCGILEIEQQYQLIEEACGIISIKRRYRAKDNGANQSEWKEQNITIKYQPQWTLNFPKDETISCGDAIPDTVALEDILSAGSCDVFGYNVTDKLFEVNGDVCLKIERTYEIINWCVYTAGDAAFIIPNDPSGNASLNNKSVGEEVGRFVYTQVIKLEVNEAPKIVINDEVATCIYGVGDALPFGEADITAGQAPYECDTIRTFSATGLNCLGEPLTSFEYNLSVDGALVINKAKGSSFNYPVEPNKTYEVAFWGYDECGNSSGDKATFQFKDCQNPSVYLLDGIAISLGEEEKVLVWAADVDRGSWDNCSPKENLDRRLALGEVSITALADIQKLDSALLLTCEHIGRQVISFFVIDEAGNFSKATTSIIVQSNNENCNNDIENSNMVTGKIQTYNGESVEQVLINVSEGASKSMITGTDGQFQFALTTGKDYKVSPFKNINPLNGVSTFDLVLISNHILGISKFDSPYQYIAADIDQSRSITAFDMVQLRQLILNITDKFPNNTSWRFIDQSYEFKTNNPANEAFQEFRSIDKLSSNQSDLDFIGVKIGDINGSAVANGLYLANERRAKDAFNIQIQDQFVEVGQKVTVAFTAADRTNIQGYQFALNFVGLEFLEIEEEEATSINFNTQMVNKSVLLTSWNGAITSNELLFSITFKVKKSGKLSEMLSTNFIQMPSEAYTTQGELLALNIKFDDLVQASKSFKLEQNTPNPFKGKTLIKFYLPAAGLATIKVMDAQGRILKYISEQFNQGTNQIIIDAKELAGTGIFYYHLESAENNAVRKMIVVE